MFYRATSSALSDSYGKYLLLWEERCLPLCRILNIHITVVLLLLASWLPPKGQFVFKNCEGGLSAAASPLPPWGPAGPEESARCLCPRQADTGGNGKCKAYSRAAWRRQYPEWLFRALAAASFHLDGTGAVFPGNPEAGYGRSFPWAEEIPPTLNHDTGSDGHIPDAGVFPFPGY